MQSPAEVQGIEPKDEDAENPSPDLRSSPHVVGQPVQACTDAMVLPKPICLNPSLQIPSLVLFLPHHSGCFFSETLDGQGKEQISFPFFKGNSRFARNFASQRSKEEKMGRDTKQSLPP